eukprot:12600192-Heterocapsa_arctica.AAC.1
MTGRRLRPASWWFGAAREVSRARSASVAPTSSRRDACDLPRGSRREGSPKGQWSHRLHGRLQVQDAREAGDQAVRDGCEAR